MKVLFYHSNCKVPGVAGFAEVSKEAYPDYTAWDSSHPYFDPKTKQDDPKWFMVEVTFVARAKHLVPLALLKHIAALASGEAPSEVDYIGADGVKAVKNMALVNRGRLSVQSVDEKTFEVVQTLAEKGGWDDMGLGKKKSSPASTKPAKKPVQNKRKKAKAKAETPSEDEDESDDQVEAQSAPSSEDEQRQGVGRAKARRARQKVSLQGESGEGSRKRKRNQLDEKDGESEAVPRRRSVRTKK
ncbi:hypothetical protein SERLADRAFT_462319 [Serpula lacrymans var. lacrymans S7.9]|uniref:EVE domain-containing protein n=1 Tax=Serpula lacrymans var. lacrymans (strain S7.9) TaxID=578457 RepID=F8NN53_SERL9|nr:uncharacterized protein SERLADRAFT_462319 [Serpula lacrymans var. lacrymans S7.9]EGO27974.1 hypothetical protein SERLADRAFT_462319 [Serpula lacrymans var. lacrymans S7.9]